MTPFLGDFDDTANPAHHILLDSHQRWVIIPLNSANYCGSLVEPDGVDPDRFDSIMATLDPAEAKGFRRLLLRDLPRIEGAHLDGLVAHLDSLHAGAGLIKIVALHHQLIPVSTREEVKPYEALTNLGLLRSFLGDRKIDVVLHGHKHVERAYVDRVGDPPDVHQIVVISGGTIGLGSNQSVSFREIELDVKFPAAPVLRLQTIPVLQPGHTSSKTTAQTFGLWEGAEPLALHDESLIRVCGRSIDETYDRVQCVLESMGHASRVPFVCQVDRMPDRVLLPAGYPAIDGEKKQNWLEEIVNWWQSHDGQDAQGKLHFTHGERIFLYHGKINQLDQAAKDLQRADSGGRAVITLLDPTIDRNFSYGRWPSFCLLQFMIRESRALDAIAYFRHQEMRYWWPVNIAEISEISRQLLDRLSPLKLSLGRITTFSALAHIGNAPSFVAVPEIDRLAKTDRNKLWTMVYALIWEAIPNRLSLISELTGALKNLIPPRKGDITRAPISTTGIKFVKTTLAPFLVHHRSSKVIDFAMHIGLLDLANDQYVDRLTKGSLDAGGYKEWVDSATSSVNAAIEALSQLEASSEDYR